MLISQLMNSYLDRSDVVAPKPLNCCKEDAVGDEDCGEDGSTDIDPEWHRGEFRVRISRARDIKTCLIKKRRHGQYKHNSSADDRSELREHVAVIVARLRRLMHQQI